MNASILQLHFAKVMWWLIKPFLIHPRCMLTQWNNGCNSITPCALSMKGSNLSRVCLFFFCNYVAAAGLSLFTVRGISGGICFIWMWHRVTFIQIQLQESILWYCSERHAVKWQVWSLLHVLYCPGAQSEIMLGAPSEMCRWGCHICVMYCKESLGFVTRAAICAQRFRSQGWLSFLAIFLLFQQLLSDCLSVS